MSIQERNKLIHIHSAVEGKVPSASILEFGELAVNYNVNEPFISFKDTEGNIIKIESTKLIVGDLSELTAEEKELTSGDTIDQALLNIYSIVENDEYAIATALNEQKGLLNDHGTTLNEHETHLTAIDIDIEELKNKQVELIVGDLSGLTGSNKELTSGDTIDQALLDLHKIIEDNEFVTAQALTAHDNHLSLHDEEIEELQKRRIPELKVGDLTGLIGVEKDLTEGDTIDQALLDLHKMIDNDETVISAALNEQKQILNDYEVHFASVDTDIEELKNKQVELIVGDLSGLTGTNKELTSGDTIDQALLDLHKIIDDNERVISSALNNQKGILNTHDTHLTSIDVDIEELKNKQVELIVGDLSGLTGTNKELTSGDTIDQALLDLHKIIEDNEFVTAQALTTHDNHLALHDEEIEELQKRKVDLIVGDLTGLEGEEKELTEGDTIDQALLDLHTIIENNEDVTAQALNLIDNHLGLHDDAIDNLKDDLFKKQDALSAGSYIEITPDNTINCTLEVDNELFILCESLPEYNIKENKIYIVTNQEGEDDNVFIEYAYIDGAWEKFGEFTSKVNLLIGDLTGLEGEELPLTEGDTIDKSLLNIHKIIQNDEITISRALNEHETRINDMEVMIQSIQNSNADLTKEIVEDLLGMYAREDDDSETEDVEVYNKQEIDAMIGDINSVLDNIIGG